MKLSEIKWLAANNPRNKRSQRLRRNSDGEAYYVLQHVNGALAVRPHFTHGAGFNSLSDKVIEVPDKLSLACVLVDFEPSPVQFNELRWTRANRDSELTQQFRDEEGGNLLFGRRIDARTGETTFFIVRGGNSPAHISAQEIDDLLKDLDERPWKD